ncbi:MAG: MATE family efflux transporter [Geminicoccaceae bacterium]
MPAEALAPLDLADPRLGRLILRLGLPSVAGLAITALHHVANAFFVGLVGVDAMAAVSVAVPIFVLVAAVGDGLGVGAAAAIGRLLGAGSQKRAGVTASTVLALAVAVGGLATLVLLLGLSPILTAFGATPALLPEARLYVGLLAWSCAFLLAQQLCDFIAIAEGNSRFSMWVLLGCFGLNLVLDPLLILAAGLGVQGAAIATLLSQLAALLAYAAYFRRRRGTVRVALGLVRWRWRLVGPVLQVGVPAMLSGMLTALALALVYRAAAGHGGEAALAGIGIALRLLTLGLLPLAGFCLGAQAVLSHGHGAGTHGRVLRATRLMLLATSGCALAYALAMLLLAQPIVGLLTDDPAARAIGVQAAAPRRATPPSPSAASTSSWWRCCRRRARAGRRPGEPRTAGLSPAAGAAPAAALVGPRWRHRRRAGGDGAHQRPHAGAPAAGAGRLRRLAGADGAAGADARRSWRPAAWPGNAHRHPAP